MNKADEYYKETIREILLGGEWSQDPRTKWADGTPAHYKQVRQKVYNYNILNGELPITTLRNTPIKGCFYEMEWIYIKQSNRLEDAHPSIHGWWKDFIVDRSYRYTNRSDRDVKNSVFGCNDSYLETAINQGAEPVIESSYIGSTYGWIVEKYNLIGKLLHDMENNPESRRLNMDLWQEGDLHSQHPKPLPPCAYRTEWAISQKDEVKYIDFTLYQRSRDLIMTFSINPLEYVMLAMMIANHLTLKTGVLHKVRNFQHLVFNEHIYQRHMEEAQEILLREPLKQPKVELHCEPKNFFKHTIEDFYIEVNSGVRARNNEIELAV